MKYSNCLVAMTEMLPGILTQLGAESLTGLRKLAANFTQQGTCFPVHTLKVYTSQKF